EERLEVLGAVDEVDGHLVAPLELGLLREVPRETAGPIVELAEGRAPVAADDGLALGRRLRDAAPNAREAPVRQKHLLVAVARSGSYGAGRQSRRRRGAQRTGATGSEGGRPARSRTRGRSSRARARRCACVARRIASRCRRRRARWRRTRWS